VADVGIRISATDQTKAAFDSAGKNMARLSQDAESLQASVAGFAGKFGALGAAVTAAFTGASLKSVIDLADQMDDLAEKTGIATKELSALRYAGEVVGTPLDALSTGLRKLSINMAAAAGGSKEQAAAFNALGVSYQNGEGKLRSSSAVIGDLATKFAGFKDGPEKAALAVELFGKAGADLIPLLNQGATGIESLREEGERLGAVFGGELSRAAADFNDNLKRIGMAAEGSKLAIAAELLPTINQLVTGFISAKDGTNAFATAIGTGLRTALEASIVLASDVKFVLVSMGRELGAIGAQMASLIKLDFKGFKAISDAVKEDGVRARAELDKFQRDLLSSRYLNSQAGAGRGTAVDPRILGDIKTNAPIVLKDTAKAVQDLTKAFDGLASSIAKEQALADEQLMQGRALTESEKFRVTTLEAIGQALEKNNITIAQAVDLESAMTKAVAKRAQVEQFMAAGKASELRQQTLLKEADAIREFVSQTEASYLASARASEDAVTAAQDEYDAFEKTKSQLAQIALLRLQDKLQKFSSGTVGYESTQREIAAQKELIQILQKGELREAAAVSAKEAAEEWKRVSNQIEQSLTDALLRGFESGKGFVANFRDTIVNMFKTLVLRPIISAVVNPVAQGITGALGLSGASSAANAASTASSLAGMGSFASGFANGLSAWGSGGSVSAMAANPSLYTAAELAGAAGPIAAAIIATYIVAKGMNGGESRSGGSYNIGADGRVLKSQGPSGGEIAPDIVRTVTDTTTATITKLLASFGSTATLTGWMSGLEASTQGKGFVYAGGSINGRSFGESDISQKVYQRGNMTQGTTYMDEAGNTQTLGGGYDGQFTDQQALQGYATDLQRSILQALQVADLGGAIGSYVTALGDVEAMTADNVSTTLAQVTAYGDLQAALKGLPFDYLKNASVEASVAIIDAAGGIESLGSKLGSYYANFYSDTERTELTLASLGKTLGDVGLTLPTTRDGFRELVEAQNLNTEAGRAGYTTLLSVADAFAGVVPASTAAAEAVTQISARLESLKKENLDLQDQYDQLTLSQAAYRDKLIAGYSAEEQAAARVNFAIQDKIAAYGAEQKAASDAAAAAAQIASAAAAKAKEVADQRAGLEQQILQLEGNTAALRQLELADLDASNQALQLRINALKDEATAAQAAAQAASDAAAKTKQIADQRAGLEQQILQLEGNTAALRLIELAGLDASNQALQLRIYTLKDEATAAQAAAQAASDAAAKAKQIADQRAGLEQQILQLEGNTAALRLIELASLDASNQALQLRINALKDEATAAQAAAQAQATAAQAAAQAASEAAAKAKQIGDERAGLERQILQLTGNTAALRQIELASLDASNQALQLRINTLNDEATAAQAAAQAQATAAQAAAQAASEAAAKAKQIGDERAGLERQILQLTGNTAALRQIELASLDASNQALQLRIYALQDEATAAAKAAESQEQYRAALQEANTYLAGFARNIQTYIGNLNATPAGMQSPGRQLLSARDQYNEQLSLARQGNRDAMGSITQFADQYINAGAATASTRGDASMIVNQIKRELSALPAQIRPEDLIITAIKDQTPLVTNALDTYLSRTSQLIVSGFKTIDLNTDGLLSFEELKQAGLASDDTIQSMILLLDTNNDGMVNLIEAQISATESITDALLNTIADKFDAIDLDVDGLIDLTELRKIFGSVASDETLKSIITAIDTNGDGQISELEAIKSSSKDVLSETTNGVVKALNFLNVWLSLSLSRIEGHVFSGLLNSNSIVSYLKDGLTVKSQNRTETNKVFFAKGGYVDRATAFALGSGIGIMGEAGGEFILPAARMANGQMGVQASMPDLSIYSKPEANAAALLAEIRNLREEVAQLRSESRAGDQAIASATSKTAKILERVTPDGASLQTTPAT
jgi:Ca2+-binding EF-hand superfamily protein/regulator of replication initiation timing